jgi:putative ubiquitin-RnfH superfamily antitoxin RatB of RatAB toxin-antitoxin module
MRTPYDTGKVKIGLYYEPPKYMESDPDMIAIQGWLIGDNKEARRRYWANVIYMALLIVTVIAMIVSL